MFAKDTSIISMEDIQDFLRIKDPIAFKEMVRLLAQGLRDIEGSGEAGCRELYLESTQRIHATLVRFNISDSTSVGSTCETILSEAVALKEQK